MLRTEVFIIALAESQSKTDHYVIVLEDPHAKKRIPLVIGENEAQAIAIHLENFQISRPLTHDLFKNSIQLLGYNLKEICIDKVENEVFYARLYFINPEKQIFELDARPSDALALAVRFDAPIYINNEVIELVGYDTDEKGIEKKGSYAEFSMEELEDLLAQIIKKEDYESAARVRDAIDRRKKN